MASHVYVKNPNGTTYVYENISYWNPTTKKTEHKRKCIGKLDPNTDDIVPTHKKNEAPTSDLSQGQCRVVGNGISLLLNKIAHETGLLKVLRNIFREDWQQILTCAYFLVSEGNALCHVERWSARHTSPYENSLTSQRISELLTRVTPSLQMDFFKAWTGQHKNDEYYALDITSISSYAEAISFVRNGYNRDGDHLAQINLLLVTGGESHMPLYYQAIPGSIKDVSTLTHTLQKMRDIHTGKLHLVMDKGFYSKDNIDELYSARMKFLIGVPFTVGFAREQVERARENDIMSHKNYRMIFEDELFVTTSLEKWNGHRLYVHVYYDSYKAEMEYKKFNQKLYLCFKELETGNLTKKNAPFYEEYFTIKETPKRGRTVTYNQEAIDAHRTNTVGWFVMITNDMKDPVKALEIYRRKDTAEKSFDNIKNDLDGKRLRIHSVPAMEGRLFIQFIALILSERIQLTMHQAGWFKNHSMQDVISEMHSLQEVSVQGRRKKYHTTPTNFQRQIAKLFDLKM